MLGKNIDGQLTLLQQVWTSLQVKKRVFFFFGVCFVGEGVSYFIRCLRLFLCTMGVRIVIKS